MKKSLVFILFLLNSLSIPVFACGFYPYGEDIRFCFSKPNNFALYSFSEFDYSSDLFYPNSELFRTSEENPNNVFWHNYCKGKVNYDAIEECVYSIPLEQFNNKSANKMVQYFYLTNDLEALEYLKFAKQCEVFNAIYNDPWERNESVSIPERGKMIQLAEKQAQKVKNTELQKRYAFLAIRLAYYNGQTKDIVRLFDSHFSDAKQKDLVYYWSLYFRAITESNKALQSYYAAQVFVNAPDKRFAVFYTFDKTIAIKNILSYAKTNEEKANIYALAAIRKHDQALEYIEKVSELDASNVTLPFLLLREVNKLEDWVFTPYFSLYDPSVNSLNDNEKYSNEFSLNAIQSRIIKDRQYAKKVLEFASKVKLKKISNPTDWNVLKVQLLFITEDFETCLKEISDLEKTSLDKESQIYNQLQLTKALCLVSKEKQGSAKISNEIHDIIVKNKSNSQFIFAIGRLLEYKGNKIDAALLFSTLQGNVTWKSSKNKTRSYVDYFYDYFQYINVMYSVDEVKSLIADIEENSKSKDAFSNWKYSFIKNEIPRLYDLVGTQYIRKNNLEKALVYFNKVDNKQWDNYYGLWQRMDNNGNYFDENPFYTLKYTPDFIKKKENFQLNKKTVTAKLIEYIEKAEKTNNKDYYYFLVANCYYNMTIHGNAWMMRRFGVSAYDVEPYPEDEAEFRNGFLAKKYYQLAFKNAKDNKFKALCLRMIGRCESFEIMNESPNINYREKNAYNDSIFKLNKTYKKLKDEYPNYYEDLIYGCTAFEDYFKAKK